jgi:ribosome-binding protein aMBF1 (putative translation factor)
MPPTPQTLHLAGRDFVIMERREYERLVGIRSHRHRMESGVTGDVPLPRMPAKLPSGNYPALESLRTGLARKLITRRWAARLSQVELAKRAGIRPEMLNRIEKGKITPTVATVTKLDNALARAENHIADLGERVG